MEAIASGFVTNRTIESLTLRGMSLHTSAHLGALLSGPFQPKHLKLLDINIFGPWQSDLDLTSSQCESLHIHLMSSAMGKWQIGLLQQLPCMPRLKGLSLECIVDGPDLTPFLVTLLSTREKTKAQPTLKYLKLAGGNCRVDHARIATALKNNHVLQSYECDSRVYMDPAVLADINYCTNLNAHGRTQIVEGSITHCSKETLVDLLVNASSISDTNSKGTTSIANDKKKHKRLNPMEIFNIHFGILSLVPSLWSNMSPE